MESKWNKNKEEVSGSCCCWATWGFNENGFNGFNGFLITNYDQCGPAVELFVLYYNITSKSRCYAAYVHGVMRLEAWGQSAKDHHNTPSCVISLKYRIRYLYIQSSFHIQRCIGSVILASKIKVCVWKWLLCTSAQVPAGCPSSSFQSSAPHWSVKREQH